MIRISISGGLPAGRVTAGQVITAALAGLVTFPDRATSWDGAEWVILCEAADAGAVREVVSGVMLDGFTVAVVAVTESVGDIASIILGGDVPPVDVLFAPPAKTTKKANRRATPSRQG